MSDVVGIVCLAVGWLYILFTIGDLKERVDRLKENLDLTRMRVAILEKLREEEEEDEECHE